MLLIVVFSLVVSVSYVLPTPKDKEFIFIFQIVNSYFPQWETLFVLVMKPTIFVLTYTGASIPGFTILYYYGHANLQKLMIIHYVLNINANYTKLEYVSSACIEYHQIVKQRLVFCVKHHIRLVT